MAMKALEISRLQPRATAYKVADEHGLYLQVQPSGTRLWRLKFRFRGVEKKLALGQYPEVSLKDARAKRDEARRLLANGVDPAAAKRQAAIEATISAATTFKLVADEFIDKMEREGKKPVTIKKAHWFRDLVDHDIGHRPVSEITPHELLNALRKVERKGHHETAQRLCVVIGAGSETRSQVQPGNRSLLAAARLAPRLPGSKSCPERELL